MGKYALESYDSEQEPRSWHCRVNGVTRLGAGWSWIQILTMARDFSFHQMSSRLAVVTTQPAIQLTMGTLSLGVKQLGHEAEHSSQ